MKWTYSLKNKLTAALLLGFVMTVILWNNLIDRSNSKEIEYSIETLYEDRLVAESIILNLSEHLHQVREQIQGQEVLPTENQKSVNHALSEIKQLVNVFRKTRLTKQEELQFKSFEIQCRDLAAFVRQKEYRKAEQHTTSALHSLNELSSIQLMEAKSVMKSSKILFSEARLSSMFEIAMIVIVGLIIQALVFASKPGTGTVESSWPLN
jgi:hypothetical protein